MNMRRYFCGLTILMCACLCVTGCREQADLEVTGGRFDITLQDGSSAQPTRVRPYEVTGEMKKQFVLHIADETDRSWFSGTMEQYEKASPALKPGNFVLSAYLGDNLPLALDAPYYVADNTTASIRAGQVTAVTLQCKVGNSMASFAFADPDAAATLLPNIPLRAVWAAPPYPAPPMMGTIPTSAQAPQWISILREVRQKARLSIISLPL